MEQEELIREYRHYCSLLWHGQHIEQANQWFLSFSSNQSSWKLSYFILSNYTNTTNSAVDGRDHHHHENYEIYEIFFAIKILHQYIQSMWDELGVNECFLIKEV